MKKYFISVFLLFLSLQGVALAEPLKFTKQNSFMKYGIATYYRPFEVEIENKRQKTIRLVIFTDFDDPKLRIPIDDQIKQTIIVSQERGYNFQNRNFEKL